MRHKQINPSKVFRWRISFRRVNPFLTNESKKLIVRNPQRFWGRFVSDLLSGQQYRRKHLWLDIRLHNYYIELHYKYDLKPTCVYINIHTSIIDRIMTHNLPSIHKLNTHEAMLSAQRQEFPHQQCQAEYTDDWWRNVIEVYIYVYIWYTPFNLPCYGLPVYELYITYASLHRLTL